MADEMDQVLDLLSDEQLKQVSGGADPFDLLSDEQLKGLSEPKRGLKALVGGFVESAKTTAKDAAGTAVDVGRFVDAYSGAPTRAAAKAALSGENPVSAFKAQFGEQPESAPTGGDLYDLTGLPNVEIPSYTPGPMLGVNAISQALRGKNVSTREVGGLAADVGLDVTNLIPAGAAIKYGTKAAAGTGKALLKGAGYGVKGAAAAADLAVGGTRAAKTVETLGNIAKRTADTISSIGTPKRVENFAKLVKTAERANINPNNLSAATEFGKTGMTSRLERSIREGSTGGELFERFKDVGVKLSDAIDNGLLKLSNGKVLDPIATGENLKRGYAAAQKKMFDSIVLTYRKASQLSPNLQLTPEAYKSLSSSVNGLERAAKGFLKRGATAEQTAIGRDLLGFVGRFRKNGANYKQLSEQISYIGKAFDSPNLPREQAKILKDFYGELSDALIKTVGDISPDLGKQLLNDNKVMSEFFKSRDAMGRLLQDAGANPESVYRNMLGDVTKIDELKKILPVEEFNSFRGSFLDSLIKRNSEGFVSYETSINNIKKNAGKLSRMFTPEELENVTDFLELGVAEGIPVLSTSGTAASTGFRKITQDVTDGLFNEGVLNRMKARGRGAVPESERILNFDTPKPPPKTFSQQMRRGPMERRLKALQSVAPSTYKKEEK